MYDSTYSGRGLNRFCIMLETKITENGGVIMKDYYGNGFWKEEEGIGIVEIILILVVLVALVLLFKNNIVELVNNAFSKINSDSDGIQSEIE